MNKLFLVLLVSAGLLVEPGAALALTQEELRNSLSSLKYLDSSLTLEVKPASHEAFVGTYKNSDTDKDCKIDAVLIAKAAMDLDKTIVKAKVTFYSTATRKPYGEVTVGIGSIAAYGHGEITHDQLLDSLDLIKTNSATAVVPPSKDGQSNEVAAARLTKIKQSIEQLKAQGVGITAFASSCSTIEQDIEHHNSEAEISEKLTKLESALKQLQENRKSVRTSVGSSAARVATSVSASASGPPQDSSTMWTIKAGPLMKERGALYEKYQLLQQQHRMPNSCWYTYKELEDLAAQRLQLAEQYNQLLQNNETRDKTNAAAMEIMKMTTKLGETLAAAYQYMGMPVPPKGFTPDYAKYEKFTPGRLLN